MWNIFPIWCILLRAYFFTSVTNTCACRTFRYFPFDHIVFSSPEPKAHWWAYSIGRYPSSVLCRTSFVVRLSTFSNIFSSEATGPIEAKLYVEVLWVGETKVPSNGYGHMTKMAAMPIYGKNLKNIFFSRTKRPLTLNLGIQHCVLKYYQIWWSWVDLDLFYGKVKFGPLCFCMGKR